MVESMGMGYWLAVAVRATTRKEASAVMAVVTIGPKVAESATIRRVDGMAKVGARWIASREKVRARREGPHTLGGCCLAPPTSAHG